MKSSIAAGIVTLSLVTGIGVAYAVDASWGSREGETAADGGRPSSTPPTPTPSPTSRPSAAGPIRPGAVDPVSAGMAVSAAIATGYLEPDKERGEACQGDFYRWTDPNQEGLDVITNEGRISSIGIRSSRYRTQAGIGVGSRLSEVKAAYPSGRIEMTSDYGQPGILIHDGDRWLGMLFGEVTPKQLDDNSMVTFAEVSTGDRPGLLRDGC